MKNNQLKIIITVLIIVLAVLTIIFVMLNNKKTVDNNPVVVLNLTDEEKEEIENAVNEELLKKVKDMTEQQRIEYYATLFFKSIENRKYKDAYSQLNDQFKKNYFATEESFKEYVKAYFPKELAVKYINYERLGNLYVIKTQVDDILSNNDVKSFEMYVVIQENQYADYELSFSVDKPMEYYNPTEEEEDDE